MMKILTIIGARPQIIKSATLSRIIKNNYSSCINEVVVHTGQHYDENMSAVFFKDLGIPKPKYHLDFGGLSHGAMTGRMIESIEGVCINEKPDWLLVYGDTNSTLAGAIVASKLNIKLAHVEAGLRSYNTEMPEEINRIITDRISTLLLCPTSKAVQNLNLEGFANFPKTQIINVGDIMYEGAIHFAKKATIPSELKKNCFKKFVLATIHRSETTNNINNLCSIVKALNKINEFTPVIVPIHPRTLKIIKDKQIKTSFHIINPVGYLEMIWLIQNCEMIITDSGGLQKEAYFFNKICLTTRIESEWQELLDSRNNILVGYDFNNILGAFKAKRKFKDSGRLYGEGNTSELIIKSLINYPQ